MGTLCRACGSTEHDEHEYLSPEELQSALDAEQFEAFLLVPRLVDDIRALRKNVAVHKGLLDIAHKK